jgi:hypothetical protein
MSVEAALEASSQIVVGKWASYKQYLPHDSELS